MIQTNKSSATNMRTARVVTTVCPTLWGIRWLIHQAFSDALERVNGRPTQDAIYARRWIDAKTDWTLRHLPPPPEDVRAEFPGTFEWCCRWLGENPDDVRKHGLSPVCEGRPEVVGIDEVLKAWEETREQFISGGCVEKSGQMYMAEFL